MNLSKTKYCSGLICKKKLWLDKNKHELKNGSGIDSILENGKEVGEIAKNYLGEHINIEYDENKNNMLKATEEACKNDNVVVTEASFNFDGNFCSVDLLKKEKDKYQIFEVKSSNDLLDIYIDDVTYQYFVLTSLGLKVSKCFVLHIDNTYVKNGDLELDKLFKKIDVTKEVKNRAKEIQKTIDELDEYLKKDEQEEKIDKKCFSPYECPFVGYCTKKLPKPNIFNVKRIKIDKKLSYYNEGFVSFEELLKSDIDDNSKEQIEFELTGKKAKIEKEKIREFMKEIKYPIYFLDFETFQDAIPKYDNTSPYQQIPFQYSLHYFLNTNCKLNHREFLSRDGIDPRRKLAESLIKEIPDDVCVLAYNMSFEKMVIKDLAKQFPDLSDHLMKIHDNIRDLMIPFKERWYYNKKMQGSYSIKYVLPALFPNDELLNYHNLENVHNGTEAMNAFKNLSKLNEQKKIEMRKSLLKYCELDTFAMVKIWELLKDI